MFNLELRSFAVFALFAGPAFPPGDLPGRSLRPESPPSDLPGHSLWPEPPAVRIYDEIC